MENLALIKNNSDKMQFGLQQLLRKILHSFYTEGKYYDILFGKLRGMKSCYRGDINFHIMMGLWEKDSLKILSELFEQFELTDKKIIAADVGANTGYYSLFFSKYLNAGSKIFAFEPDSSILDILEKNLEINHISNVQVLSMACSDQSGEIDFFEGDQHYHSSILSEWGGNKTSGIKMRVKSISLDDFFSLQNNGEFPDLIKMDIEGGGVFALKGCHNCIVTKRPFMLIESHTSLEDQAIGNVLREYNYEAYRLTNKKWVKKKDKDYRDPEGVWGTMLLLPEELKNKFVI